ncbi:PREDICTED: transmembrane protein 252 [Chrysochloris asiatica]|uniref:Transmembrane protein 252 n=1 Tax=Chrysochloris asiatica TaxID=185453 RepID=A0A9B0WN93_CHRAS|nr:PREDICTED: transmembrane protein 252 [Chrysochloris asiatica]
MQDRSSLLLCALTLLTGFLVVCLGAFFISSGSVFSCRGNLIAAYLLLPLGFVILLSGIFWSTYRQACKSKRMFSHVVRQHLAQGSLATVDRPDFYPPAYEESPGAVKQTWEIPPPMYTELGLDVHAQPEAPPPYQEFLTAMAYAATCKTLQGSLGDAESSGGLGCCGDQLLTKDSVQGP